jgi:hypothetical protein
MIYNIHEALLRWSRMMSCGRWKMGKQFCLEPWWEETIRKKQEYLENNIKWILRQSARRVSTGFMWLGIGLVVAYYEHGTEHSDSTHSGNFLTSCQSISFSWRTVLLGATFSTYLFYSRTVIWRENILSSLSISYKIHGVRWLQISNSWS